MVLIPAGEFLMGSPEGEGHDDEHPRRKVHLEAFRMDEHPVSVEQYREFCQSAGRTFPKQPDWSADDQPVVSVSWDDAAAFAAWAGKRLPTEAEWEKAARGGTSTTHPFGDESLLGEYAWFRDNSDGRTHPVSQKRPNPYGLFDMQGNVWEWTADWYGAQYYAVSPERCPKGPATGEARPKACSKSMSQGRPRSCAASTLPGLTSETPKVRMNTAAATRCSRLRASL